MQVSIKHSFEHSQAHKPPKQLIIDLDMEIEDK